MKYRQHATHLDKRSDGSLLLTNPHALDKYVHRSTDWLDHWATETPDAIFLAERSGAAWRELSYREVQECAQAIASGLISANLNSNTPILIVSGNSVNHALLALAAQYVGIPIVPLAEQYALIKDAHKQIDFVARLVKPGMVYAEDGDHLADVLARDVFNGVIKLVSNGSSNQYTQLSNLLAATGDISAQVANVGPDTVAKILMTSGSTSAPKGVPTTHRMMCANQAQIAYALPFLAQHKPLIVDWLPWNHVFGGSHNFNMMLANGGALYIDSGKPAPHLFGKTLENLQLKTGTMVFNVPVGFAMMRDELKRDKSLRQRYFENMDMLFYAGASLPQDVWADLEAMAKAIRGDVPLFTSSWGLTETAPAVLLQHQPTDRSGVVGVPLPGTEVKLIPDDEQRFEIRVKGPNVFSEYFENPEQSVAAFDEEGFFKTGDAMLFVDPDKLDLGLRFDGRLSEEFKLLSGTWVKAANLRLKVLGALAGIAQDVVITGADRQDIGLLIVPSATVRSIEDAVSDKGTLIIDSLKTVLNDKLLPIGSSSSTKIARVLFLEVPPSMAEGEITAKGSLNFRKILSLRKPLLDRLYDDADKAVVLINKVPE